ncbi:acyl-CoA thioesterase [Paraglaciecola sp.]|uniref:acyl-CoA thioesterase n=1 Tax=Paraglaciecola sp. TaxID=1920173 RepID=UPI0030F43652
MSTKRAIDFRFLAEPTDVNFGGKVHGGIVMKWMDQAGYACAAQYSGKYCVTVSIGAVRFVRPILVGQLVTLKAKVVHTGSTSMHIFIEIEAGDPKYNKMENTGHCLVVFVACDENGNPVNVANWHAESAVDVALEQYAIEAKQAAKSLDARLHQALTVA